MKFKLDENLSPSLLAILARSGHDAHSVVQQSLGGAPDDRVIDVCRREGRALITLDMDFSNILAYPPSEFPGIVVLRLADQAHVTMQTAIQRVVDLLPQEPLVNTLWIVEQRRIRIRG